MRDSRRGIQVQGFGICDQRQAIGLSVLLAAAGRGADQAQAAVRFLENHRRRARSLRVQSRGTHEQRDEQQRILGDPAETHVTHQWQGRYRTTSPENPNGWALSADSTGYSS